MCRGLVIGSVLLVSISPAMAQNRGGGASRGGANVPLAGRPLGGAPARVAGGGGANMPLANRPLSTGAAFGRGGVSIGGAFRSGDFTLGFTSLSPYSPYCGIPSSAIGCYAGYYGGYGYWGCNPYWGYGYGSAAYAPAVVYVEPALFDGQYVKDFRLRGRGTPADALPEPANVGVDSPRTLAPSDGRGGNGIARPSADASFDELIAALRAGDRAFSQGQYDDARDAYLRAMVADGNNAQALIAYGLAEFALGRFDAAAAPIRKALIVRPTLARTALDLRRMFSNTADLEKRMSELKQRVVEHAKDHLAHGAGAAPAVADEPAHRAVSALLLLGFAQFFGGDAAAGREAFERYAAAKPDDDGFAAFLKEARRVTPAAR